MGNIFDQETTSSYYQVQGKDVEPGKNTPDTLLESLIPETLQGKTVLDLGAGNGRYTEILAKRGADRVIALDLSQSMTEETKARKDEQQLDNLEIVRGDFADLPIGEKKIDFVFSRFALMYTDKLAGAVESLARSLRDGGEMLFEVNVATMDNQMQSGEMNRELVPLILSHGDKSVNIKNFAYTLEEYQSAFENAGLKIVALEQFPADDLTVDPKYPNAEKFHFKYTVFKAFKADRE